MTWRDESDEDALTIGETEIECQNFPSIYNRWLKESFTESGKF